MKTLSLVVRAGLLPALLLFTTHTSQADSATWKVDPASSDWNTFSNWSPETVPNGPLDIATFSTSNNPVVTLSVYETEVDSIVFNSSETAYTIIAPASPNSPHLNLTGQGIINSSGITQSFVAASDASMFAGGGWFDFFNNATAGDSTSYELIKGSGVYFYDFSSAGRGTFTLTGDPIYRYRSFVNFYESSTAQRGNFTLNIWAYIYFWNTSSAGNGTFTINGDPAFLFNSYIIFQDSATAPNAKFKLNGPAYVSFYNTSSAGSSEFILNTGGASGYYSEVYFETGSAGEATFYISGARVNASPGSDVLFGAGDAGAASFRARPGSHGGYGGHVMFTGGTGGTSQVWLDGHGTGDYTDGYLDITLHELPGVTIGSLEGGGSVFLGSNTLTVAVGSNIDQFNTFSGLIADCPAGVVYCGLNGPSGSLSKTGTGALTLSPPPSGNLYTGGTTVSDGTLYVRNKTGSATGTGNVQVNGGTLGGIGQIAGSGTIGNGVTSGAILLPGDSFSSAGRLKIKSALTFNSLSTYQCVLNRTRGKAGNVVAKGVTINSNVGFTFSDTGSGTLAPGTVFIVLNNTSANPIAGTFSNLPNNSIFTSNGTGFKASYTGGTGNDLTLTVQ